MTISSLGTSSAALARQERHGAHAGVRSVDRLGTPVRPGPGHAPGTQTQALDHPVWPFRHDPVRLARGLVYAGFALAETHLAGVFAFHAGNPTTPVCRWFDLPGGPCPDCLGFAKSQTVDDAHSIGVHLNGCPTGEGQNQRVFIECIYIIVLFFVFILKAAVEFQRYASD